MYVCIKACPLIALCGILISVCVYKGMSSDSFVWDIN